MLVPTLKVKQPYLLEEILEMPLEKKYVHKMNIFLSKAYHFSIFIINAIYAPLKKSAIRNYKIQIPLLFPTPYFLGVTTLNGLV